jgi:hypothetical protein
MGKKYVYRLIFCLLLASPHCLWGQSAQVNVAGYDGFVVLGYVNDGGFLNFTGPNINLKKGKSKWVLGMLPSLRFKQDTGTTRNAFVTPNLGCGLTYSYKIWAIQIPLYYNAKTPTQDGQWHIGIGVGLRLNYLKSATGK